MPSLQDAINNEKTLIVGNAPCGSVKTVEDVRRACRSGATRITVGSITLSKRIGNTPAGSFGTYYFNPETLESGNALGLNNMGLDEFLLVVPEMLELAHAAGKKLIASVAGFSIEEITQLVCACLKAGVDGVEINFGCPNVYLASGERKAIFSYEPDLFGRSLAALKHTLPRDWDRQLQPLGAKVSPVEHRGVVARLSDAVSRTDIIDEIVAVNTDPDHRFLLPGGVDALAFYTEGSTKTLHRGGQAGAPLREIRRRVVRLWRELQPNRKIIAVGGIFTGLDAYEAVNEDGANGFECATSYIENGGPLIFNDILEDYAQRIADSFGEREARIVP